ncbi:hillarin-like [Branchiostoma floridae x Branchiostoma belcheri]
MASNVPDLTTPVSVGGCPICDNRSSKDATWAEQFHLTEERLRDLAKCNEKTDGLNTFKELVAFLTAQTTSDVERYWVLFHWVQRESRRRHRTSPRPLSEDNPLEFLRAVKACTGSYSYADLYKKLCSTAGLKCETVIGHRKSIGSRTDRSSAQQCKSKSWNLINVDGKRALVDCEFELNFEANRMPPCYFMARPTRFATTHFPQDQSQQLLQVSVTLEQFQCHGHSRCLPSSPRRKTARKASRATETKEGRRQMSEKPQEGESTDDHDRDLS